MTGHARSGTAEDVPPIDDWNRLLDGRVAVVTGGGDGVGAGIVRLFAQHGAHVEVAEIDATRAERIRAEVTAAGGSIRSHVVDVTSDADVARLAEAVLAAHGRVDVLVNNVGDYRPLVPFAQSTPDSWQAIYNVNLRHVFAVTRAFVPTMTDARSGSIVTVHSVEGMRGYPKDPVYGAMKAAAAHFTTCLAVDLGRHGIRVNGIGTDLAQTPQVDYLTGYEDDAALWASWAPVGRVGWPEDQARVALFLASDLSSFVTGHNIPVDGGTKAGGGWLFSPREDRFVNRSRHL
ncbi:SDR family NAD(P)-dependent oxidoreductase [Mycolicibacterium arenosum]|uniref:SDR family oxidoreductase n=1 Tax=Mycolicibacterium arenosum TaxID=2952157 RepID=A0ABT1LY79_9MYCO|nr:SDR family oxidoreductase [Mycolicibacterium sp. CAU 1645]MCP9271849.1 SDR family oxidoreductase [Mycolicibacterium sp. CAU 1645]